MIATEMTTMHIENDTPITATRIITKHETQYKTISQNP